MKLFKKIFLIAMAGVLSLTALAGCTPKRDNRDPNTLKIAFAETGYGREWLNSAIEKFQVKNPDVKFELEGDAGITAKILPRLETGTELADIFMGLQTNWQMWAYTDKLESLDDLYATEIDNGKTYEQKYNPNFLEHGKVLGHYYAIGWSDGATGIIYNDKMFAEHGWTVPKTVDELIALCEQISTYSKDLPKDKRIYPFAWGGQVGAYWNFPVVSWWAQYEGVENMKTFNKYESPEVFKQPGRLKALEAFERIMSKASYSVPGAMSKNHMSSQLDFINSRAAMIPNGAWIETEMRKNAPDGFSMKMMQTPNIDATHTDKTNYTAAGDFMVIPKEIPEANKKLAKKFLAFLAKDEMLRDYTAKTGSMRPFTYDLDNIEGVTDFAKSCIEIYKNSNNVYMFSNNPLYYKNLVNLWPATGGSPYGMIADGETAKSIFDLEIENATDKWASFLDQIK